MPPVRRINPRLAVSGQIRPEDVAALADQGFRMIVNNRPDGEEPGQPAGAEIQTAAEAAGLAYRAVPISGRPGPEQARAQAEAIAAADGPVLAYCRSGMRSASAWAMAEVAAGADRGTVLAQGAGAGCDLSAVI